ncbi:hypothetical protein IKG20_01720 [Candidatus Saccharibacteria bacterium]|nr:hypothetical protein [Candidatus Saccharibacteria bacterium]
MDPNLSQPQTPNVPPVPGVTPNPSFGAVPPSAPTPGMAPITSIPPSPAPAPAKSSNKTVIIILSVVLGLAACVGVYFAVKALLPSGNSGNNNNNNNGGNSYSYNDDDNRGGDSEEHWYDKDGNEVESCCDAYPPCPCSDESDYQPASAGATKTINFDSYTAAIPEAFSPYTIGSKLLFTSPDKSIKAEISVMAVDTYEDNKARKQETYGSNLHIANYNNREYTIIAEEGDETFNDSVVATTAFGNRVLAITIAPAYDSDADIYDLQDFFEEYVPAIVDSIE